MINCICKDRMTVIAICVKFDIGLVDLQTMDIILKFLCHCKTEKLRGQFGKPFS